MKVDLKAWAALVIVFSALLYMGFFQRSWYHHLSGDPQLYSSIAIRIFEHRDVPGFERAFLYPPGANLFFGVIEILGRNNFGVVLASINLCLLAFLFFLYKKFGTGWLWVPISLSAGPIMLFRYDLIPILLVISGTIFFIKKSYLISGLVFGLAISTKIYPIFLIPYFGLNLLVTKNLRGGSGFILGLALGSIGIAVGYLLLSGQTITSLIEGFNYNFSKSIHVESVLGTILTLIARFNFSTAPWVEFTNGILSLSFQYTMGRDRLFRYMWMVFMVGLYVLLYIKRKNIATKIRFEVIATVLLYLIVVSNVLSPQYLLWSFFLLPLIKFPISNLLLVCAVLVLTQIVYPLYYEDLYWVFYKSWDHAWVFIALLLRNIILVILVLKSIQAYVLSPKYR
jgi:hypothetical protein